MNREQLIERLVEDELKMFKSITVGSIDDYVKGLIRSVLETKSDPQLKLMEATSNMFGV